MKDTFEDDYLPGMSAKEIFNRLGDEKSCDIFKFRYKYLLERNTAKLTAEIAPRLFYINENVGDVVIFGAGALSTIYTIPNIESLGIKIKAICDTNLSGQTISGYDVITLSDMLDMRGDSPVVISTYTEGVCLEIRQLLLASGVKREMLIEPSYYMLRDQYFEPDFITPLADEVFIDAGCLDVGSILFFKNFVGDIGYKRIYAFEPSPKNYEICKANIEKHKLDDIVLIRKGLWDSYDTLLFDDDAEFGSNSISGSGCVKIETVALDDVVGETEKVTFIKMDIEGAELNALFGAKGIIKRDRPRLAICVYHKPEDIINIPSYILSLNPEYKIYLRHYSPIATETVLYAV